MEFKSYKNDSWHFSEIDKLILPLPYKYKGCRMNKTILKMILEGFMPTDFKSYYKATVINLI